MTTAKEKPLGSRGSWFAKFEGEMLPCVWPYWVKGNRYLDRGYEEGMGQWPRFLAAIHNGRRVILTGQKEPVPAPEKKSGVSLARDGYDSLWLVRNVQASSSGLGFEFERKLRSFR